MSRAGAGLADALLDDRYRLVERIAVGGMGEVWRAQDLLLGRVVAVKTLKAEYLDDEDFRARFRAEARHSGRLAHPGIASVYDFGESAEQAWLVMELVDGEPLSALLRRDGALPVDRTLDLVAQTAEALQAAHDGGVVHRDIKPGNLLVRPDGVVKVTDFGIASATDAVPLTRTGTVVGTAYYLSPEQAAGRSGSPASDLYALGVVAYECLAGRRPFAGENPVAVALAHLRNPPPPLPDTVPAPVRSLVMRALAKEPGDRFADAAELARRATVLRASLADGSWDALEPEVIPQVTGPVELAPTGLLELPARDPRALPGSRARSSRRLVRAAAVVLVLLAVGLGLRSLTTEPAVDAVAGPSSPPSEPSARASAPAAAEPRAVPVVAASYLGRPAAEVRAALREQGLVPSLAYDGSGVPVGTVSAVEPAGTLLLGSTVLVHVVPTPAAPPVTQPTPAAEAPGELKGRPDRGKGRGKK